MAQLARTCAETPNLVVIGVPNQASLERTLRKIKAANILHYAWAEPDYDFGLTAIATVPIAGKQREIFRNYRVYTLPRGAKAPAFDGSAAPVSTPDADRTRPAGFNAESGARARVA